MMKLRGILVDMIKEINPKACSKFVTCQNNKKILRTRMIKPSCGMLKASLLYCTQFLSDANDIGCVMNSCGAHTFNKIMNNKKNTLTWRACGAKSVHTSPKASNELAVWCEQKCGSYDLGYASVTRGKRHYCLVMNLDCSRKTAASTCMADHTDQMKA